MPGIHNNPHLLYYILSSYAIPYVKFAGGIIPDLSSLASGCRSLIAGAAHRHARHRERSEAISTYREETSEWSGERPRSLCRKRVEVDQFLPPLDQLFRLVRCVRFARDA